MEKKRPQMYLVDGKYYRFDRQRFLREFSRHWGKRNGTDRRIAAISCSQTIYPTRNELIKEIAERCHVSVEAVNKWIRKEGFSDPNPDVIHILEDILEVERNYFLKKDNVEDNAMSILAESKVYARELYGTILECINTIPTVVDFVCSVDAEPVWGGTLRERYNTILAVKKTAFDLPEDIRNRTIELINDIYGPEVSDYDTPYESDDYIEWINSDEYQTYLNKLSADFSRDKKNMDDLNHLNYCEYKREEFFKRLDEIFEDYICT